MRRLLLLLLAPLALAQSVLAPADKQFIHEAGIGGTHELQLSMIVPKRSEDPDVRKFARRMLDDHSKASAELKAILSRRNVSAPDDLMDPEHTAVKAQLRQLGGVAFDRLYMTTMVRDHEQALAIFQAEANGGGDPELRSFAARQIATIHEHLQQARTIVTRYASEPAAPARP